MTPYACASTVMPMNIDMAITAIVTSVAAAFFASGGRNAGTPSDTASTPVIAVQPFAKAVSSRNVVSGCVPGVGRQRHVDRHDRARERSDTAPTSEQREDADDEEVGRHGEDAARLADAAQVAEHENREEHQAHLDAVRRRATARPT